jgi:hypothetical protein
MECPKKPDTSENARLLFELARIKPINEQAFKVATRDPPLWPTIKISWRDFDWHGVEEQDYF